MAHGVGSHTVHGMPTRPTPSTPPAPLVLHYTVRSCPQGQVLVAATGQGIAAVLLGDDKASLVQELAQRYPQAQLETGGTPLHHWSDEVLALLAHPAQAHRLPLDVVGGTDFQRRVWAALQRIPGGQTCTYTQLAQALGQPRAVRAVASACAATRWRCWCPATACCAATEAWAATAGVWRASSNCWRRKRFETRSGRR